MKFLKSLAYVAVAILVVYLILCVAGPKKFEARESITIAQAQKVVFDYVSNFRTWPEWDPWSNSDSTIQLVFETPGGLGHKYSWTSENVGNGSQEIVDLRSPEYIKSALNFTDWEGTSYAEFIMEPVDGGTSVTWTMDGAEFPFFVRGMMVFMGGGDALKADYQRGLAALKEKLEAGAGISIEASEMEMPDLTVVGKRVKIHPDSLNEVFYDSVMGEIAAAIAAAGRSISGEPLAIVYNYGENEMDTEIAFPVDASFPVTAPLSLTVIPGGPVVSTKHTGPYESSASTWAQMERYMRLHAKESRFAPYEVYEINPSHTSDSSKFVTAIVYPVK